MSASCLFLLGVGFMLSIAEASDWVSREEFQNLQEKLQVFEKSIDLVKGLVKDLQEENQNLNLKVDDLKFQNDRLQDENRNMQKEIAELAELKNQMNSNIREELKSDYVDLDITKSNDNAYQIQQAEMAVSYDKDNAQIRQNGDSDHNISIGSKERIKGSQQINRHMRSSPGEQQIAFSAYITGRFDYHIGTHHVFIYDTVQCNEGNAYNRYNGMFTAPASGIYAFLWTVMAIGEYSGSDYGEVDTELMVNSESRAKARADSEAHYDDDQSTGFVILHLNAGDLVYIRTFDTPTGYMQYNEEKEWTFSGWKL